MGREERVEVVGGGESWLSRICTGSSDTMGQLLRCDTVHRLSNNERSHNTQKQQTLMQLST